jgi:hypothetical protein
MVAVLVALSAPAMADDGRNHNGNGNNHHNGWNNWDNWDNHNDFNRSNSDQFFFTNDFADDCEWEFEEGWFLGFWGLQWGAWFLDC